MQNFRKQFVPFLFLTAFVVLALIILPLIEEPIKNYVASNFNMPSMDMGIQASELFVNFVKLIKLFLWMALVIAVVRFANLIIFGAALSRTTEYELPNIIKNVISITVYIVSFFIIFQTQYPNVPLTPIFTGSTIIGVVLALALQDTLGNLFAGLALQADQPFQVGDVVLIGAAGTNQSKGTGVVESVTWRGVKIRTFQNKLVIISNAILGKEVIEVAPKDNLNARLTFFNTLYSASPTKTTHLIRDVVRQVDNVSPKMRPIVRIKNLGESGLEWEVKYWLEDYAKYNDTDALVRQRIWYAFQRENIHFAFPTRTLYVENQSLEPNFSESTNDIFERLSDVPLFEPLSDQETEKLAGLCEAKVFSPNEPIVRRGDDGNSMFVVHRGAVKILVTENGSTKTVADLSEGDIFGEMGLFTGEPRAATVVASGETEVLEIKHTAIKPLFEKNPYLIEALSKTIAERRELLTIKEETTTVSMEEHTSGIFKSIKRFFGLN